MKTYEIKYEPVIVEDIEYPKYNVYYSDGGKEFHSTDGINGTVKEGYTNVNAPNWLGLEQTLAYSALFARAVTAADPNWFSVAQNTLQNGKKGEASQNYLYYVLTQLNVSVQWSAEELIELNGYLEANNFTVRFP